MAVDWTQDDIDALKEAVKNGIQTVSYSGPPARTITYQSLAEMRKLLADMVASVDEAAGTRVRSRRVAYKKMGRSDE